MVRRLGFYLAAGAVIAACAGGTGTPGGGATGGAGATVGPGGGDPGLDQCHLLTVDEVGGVFSTEPLSAGPDTATAIPNCIYSEAAGIEALYLWVHHGENADAVFKSAQENVSYKEVPGLGEIGLYDSGARSVRFRTGAFVVELTTGPAGDNDSESNLASFKALAPIVIARLGGNAVPPELQITAPPVVAAQHACDLLSADEAASVLQRGPMAAESNPYTATFCSFSVVSTGEIILSTYLDRKGGIAAWESFTGSIAAEPVEGLGEKALFEAGTGILFVLRGDAVINANVLLLDLEPAELLRLDRALLEIMLTHL